MIALGAIIHETYKVERQLGKGRTACTGAPPAPAEAGGHQGAARAAARRREAFARFRREAEIASRIGHPNIVEVLDFNRCPSGTPYLVLEFLAGREPGARSRAGALPLDAALDDRAPDRRRRSHAAHARGVVHRDLKPDNIFLCRRRRRLEPLVKVLDFGISKIPRRRRRCRRKTTALLGTPQYMSPEQARGQHGPGRRAHRRSSRSARSCTRCSRASCRSRRPGDELWTILTRIVTEDPPPIAGMSGAAVAGDTKKGLAKDPDARYSEVAGLIEAIERALGRTPMPRTTPRRGWSRRCTGSCRTLP